MLATRATLDARPMPNQRMNSGASASFWHPVPRDEIGIEDRGTGEACAVARRKKDGRRHPADDGAEQRLLDRVAALHDQFAIEDLRGEACGHRGGRAQPVRADAERCRPATPPG